MSNKQKVLKAIDIELNEVESGGVAYYRLTKEMKDFLTLCNRKHGIIGFEYGEDSFNFGVILAKDKKTDNKINKYEEEVNG